ncbi:PepSY-associated TM helix domain-containing protein [Niabella beijingensis]|uniref:PepSY-associated TM helix domain-containing protein n=1 Tax=Niabella beijingensis TaxID=2872700 RepID=UPI001CBA7402|nr:PepSY-associated TM helix domain-containing protein [Niabella beijingensis]MBZ4191880.1 PepSY domain-containing protein [Niabella beijingensis]
MNNRNYNIYFHTHTISGIIISAVLYVIFFAGSFAFFKNEISAWQKNIPNDAAAKRAVDFNRICDSLDREYGLYGRNVSFYNYPHSPRLGVSVSGSQDTANKKAGGFFYLNIKTHAKEEYKQSYDLGEFLYRLHFLAQVNGIAKFGFPLGYYIAGAVAFIFLFALITGLLLHWRKIISNFYVFRPWEKLKTVWTDLHTALGVISFPFLFVFALTGAFFLISYPLFTKPTTTYSFGGKEDSLSAVMGYGNHQLPLIKQSLKERPDVNYFIQETYRKWEGADLRSVELVNYGDQSMQVHVNAGLKRGKQFVSNGEVVYGVVPRTVVSQKDPAASPSYTDTVQDLVYSLHFGNYGGYATRILYFLLGICGCMVIISGVLIWLVARDKRNIPEQKRKFNEWMVNVYLGICLSMFPVTAAAFIAVKIHPDGGTAFIYPFYFWTWLAVAILMILRKNIYKTNRDCMLLGAVIGLFIPVVNGVVTGSWLWDNYRLGHHDILLIDVFWLLVSAGAFICWQMIIRKQRKTELANDTIK